MSFRMAFAFLPLPYFFTIFVYQDEQVEKFYSLAFLVIEVLVTDDTSFALHIVQTDR